MSALAATCFSNSDGHITRPHNTSQLLMMLLVLPSTDNSYNAFSEYLVEKKHLGGLLILLPTKLSDKDGTGNDVDKGQVKGVLDELEKLLVHEEVPVSKSPFLYH
jgi:hypothetical protein